MSAITFKKPIGAGLDQKRDARLVVKVTAAEKRKFEKMAKERHTNVAEMMRQLLYKEAEAAA